MKERSIVFLLLIILCLFVCSPTAALIDPHTQPQFAEPLPIPAVLPPTSPGYYEVTMDPVVQEVGLKDASNNPLFTTVWGYNGVWPGKTIVAQKNVPITVKYINNLPTTHLLPVDHTLMGAEGGTPDVKTVVHLHGAHTTQANDGWPEWWFTSTGYQNPNTAGVGGPNPYDGDGNSQEYTYQNDQNAAILWYHDHALDTTRINVYAGLAAFYILTDPAEADLELPSGNYDIGLAIQDRSFNNDGSLFYPSEYDAEIGPDPQQPLPSISVVPEFFGDHIVVNGKIWPYLDVEPRKYRFRVLDGSTARFYNLALTGDPGFVPVMNVIGDEQGLLPGPVPLNNLLIAPGERYDVIIDFEGLEGHNIVMTNDAITPYPSGDPVDPTTTGRVMQFRVGTTVTDTSNNEMPSSLAAVPTLIPDPGVPERVLQLNETFDEYGRLQQKLGPNTVAGGLAWMDPITEKPVLGSTEVWSVINPTADTHPIHLHLVAFQIMDKRPFDTSAWQPGDDPIYTGPVVQPRPEEAGWKDTAQMPPGYVTRVIAKFDIKDKYVWHCHIIEHEDHEMMRPFEVIDPVADASDRITLMQDTSTATLGTPHTLTARVTGEDDKPLAGKEVLFSVITGPNAGLFATVITDADGMASFTYTSSKLGKDTIVASFDPMGTGDPSSNPVTVE